VFTSKGLSIVLLMLHLGMLGVCAKGALAAARKRSGGRVLLPPNPPALSAHYVIYTLFVSNFVGICFARTLHYQFYAWYYHTVPYLLWTTVRESNVRLVVRLLLLWGLEYAFLTFPATPTSSAVLQVCHLIILASIWVHGFPSPADAVAAAPASPIRRPAATTPGSPTKKRV
jgi:alpha-1,3-mannosyltransferase